MKKIHFLLALSMASLVFTQSCMKCERDGRGSVVANETVDATISENTTYTYILPSGNGGASQITMPAAHSGLSIITMDMYGNTVYQYTPAAGYTGADAVAITTQAAHTNAPSNNNNCAHGNCNQGGPCANHNGCQVINTTIDITVTPIAGTATNTSAKLQASAKQLNN